MTLINKNHPDIKFSHSEKTPVFMRMYCHATDASKSYFFFSAGAVRKFNLREYEYLHFDNGDTGKDWIFYHNTDTDGFKLIRLHKGEDAMVVRHAALVNMFRKSLSLDHISKKFELKKIGANCIEIITV